MLQNAYLLAKIGADTAENEQRFAEMLPMGRRAADRRNHRPLRAPVALRGDQRGMRGEASARGPAGPQGPYVVSNFVSYFWLFLSFWGKF